MGTPWRVLFIHSGSLTSSNVHHRSNVIHRIASLAHLGRSRYSQADTASRLYCTYWFADIVIIARIVFFKIYIARRYFN